MREKFAKERWKDAAYRDVKITIVKTECIIGDFEPTAQRVSIKGITSELRVLL